MRTHAHVDWLAVTYPASIDKRLVVPPVVFECPFLERGPGLHGYATSVKNENGALILCDGTEAQGVHVVLPADALLAARADGLTDRELCLHSLYYGGRATRIDFAVDVLDGAMTVADLRDAYAQGKAETSARTADERKNLETPEHTLYIGSWRSDRYFRGYNKGAQVKSETAWLRLELECKRLVARAMTQAIAEAEDTRQLINVAIRGYVDFPDLPEYQKALADCDAKLPIIPRKMTATYQWLLEQVAPCLARYQFNHPNDQIDQAFLTAWRTAYDRLVLYSQKSAE